MKTEIYSSYKRKIWAAALSGLVVLAIAVAVLMGLMGSTESPDTEKVAGRREGCVCPMDLNLPIVVIDTHGQDINIVPPYIESTTFSDQITLLHETSPKYEVDINIFAPGEYSYTCVCGKAEPALTQHALISLRGQSSLKMPKKQYSIKFISNDGLDAPREVLGMPMHHQWVLNGSHADKSQIRNPLAIEMASEVMDYAPRYEFCEVLLNASNGSLDFSRDYIGTYLFEEKIERSASRVNIEKPDPRRNDINFIIARDKFKTEDMLFNTHWGTLEDSIFVGANGLIRQRTHFVLQYPSAKTVDPAVFERIETYLNQFEYALWSSRFKNIKEGYRAYIEVDSFIHFAMINEIFKNIDGGEISTYYYKSIGGKMKCGPIWDMDLTLGNTIDDKMNSPLGLSMIDTVWFSRLFQDTYFSGRFIDSFNNYYNGRWSPEKLSAKIDNIVAELGPAIERNSKHWYENEKYPGFSYAQEIESIKDFILQRMNWMARNIELVERTDATSKQ